jgi:hypothetical protein
MKPLIGLLLLISIAGCDSDEPNYSVSAELQPYVDSFFAEAEARDKDIPQNNLHAYLDPGCQSVLIMERDGDQWIMKFNKGMFEYYATSEATQHHIEALVFHELGKTLLQRPMEGIENLNPAPFTLMNPYYKIAGFKSSEREVLLNELFK